MIGYYDPNLIADFSEENIIDCLERSDITTPEGDGGPVMVYGENINTHNGHVWVIDGYCKNISYKKDKNINRKTILFHCLWGWDGDNNGYFYLNNGKLGGAANLFAGGDNERIDDRYIYSNLKFIANFKRNTNKSKVVIK